MTAPRRRITIYIKGKLGEERDSGFEVPSPYRDAVAITNDDEKGIRHYFTRDILKITEPRQ